MKLLTQLALALLVCSSPSALAAVGAGNPARATDAANTARAADARAAPKAGEATKAKDGDELAQARAGLRDRFLELAVWCNTSELFEERDKIYRQVLELDPDNLDAHKGLRHSRAPDGTWKESSKRDAKNRNPKALADLPKKRTEAIKPFSTTLVSMARAAGTDVAARKTCIDQVLALDPDDAQVHEFQGDVRDGELWVLPDTVRGKARRAEIKGFAASALAGVAAPVAETPSATDIVIEKTWTSALRVGSVRVFGTVGAEEAGNIARSCDAAGAFAKSIFGVECPFPPQFTFYALDKKDKDAFLKRIPEIDDAERARLMKLEGSGIPRREDVALWTGDPARTLDAAVRHTLSHLFGRGFGMTTSSGWAWEAFGLYLTRELIGTRLTWFVSDSPADATAAATSLRGRLLSPKTNWMNEALTLFSSENPPDIDALMKRDLGHLDTRDVLAGYALAAYLIEARPDAAANFVKRSSAGEDPALVVKEVLGFTLPELQVRLTRWLTERR
jgi:hypothetical protein